MANIKSAHKRIGIADRNKLRNRVYRSTVKTILKKTLVILNNLEVADKVFIQSHVSLAYSSIDKAIQKGTMHPNTGNSKKALVAKHLRNRLTIGIS
uniref:Ribosomal protein S20 n=1 Tax=Cryptomonas sp. CCAC 1634B TaxID=2051848 RepID=A0A679C9U8_9CRYP|nr:ribosomal protein S20 [Cryptomonas sp. CCAC 1634B]